jgi:hypothetical protein
VTSEAADVGVELGSRIGVGKHPDVAGGQVQDADFFADGVGEPPAVAAGPPGTGLVVVVPLDEGGAGGGGGRAKAAPGPAVPETPWNPSLASLGACAGDGEHDSGKKAARHHVWPVPGAWSSRFPRLGRRSRLGCEESAYETEGYGQKRIR